MAAALLAAGALEGASSRPVAAAVLVLAAIALAAWRARRARHARRVVAAEAADRARRELLAGMGHELRTPLNSVIGFSTVLLKNRSGKLSPEELDYLERVRANGVQLLRVVEELLAREAPGGASSRPTGPAAASERPPR